MAEKNQGVGILGTLSDWWNDEGAPRAPSRIPPVDPRTGNRTKPSPDVTWGEAASNIVGELQRSHYGADYLRDLAKGAGTVIAHPRRSFESLGGIGNAIQQVLDAREFEQTGKWPESTFTKFMPKAKMDAWRQQATNRYRALASSYSYVDPKTNQRTMDWNAVLRGISKDPVGTISPFLAAGAGAAGKASGLMKVVEAGAAAAGDTRKAKAASIAAKGYKALQVTGNVGAKALNPAGTAVAAAAKPVIRSIKGLRAVQILDKDGNFTPKFEEAMREQGYDPALYSSPEAKAHFQEVMAKSGVTPAAIRKAVGTSQGVPVTRSMALQERPPSEFVPEVQAARQQGADYVGGQMETQFGHAPDERDLGGAFARAYTNAKNAVERGYQRAFGHQGVFTNTADFTAGMRASIDNELGKLGLDVNTVMGAPRFAQTQNALGGFRRGGRQFGGVFSQFDDLAGAAPPTAITAADLSGEMHTFDTASGRWLDASGNPVTATGKSQYLDAVSNRVNLPPPQPGVNGLTPQNIDGVRRDVNSFYLEAKTAEDRAALAAINRGIDNYVETNAANFTGDGQALAQDLQNARGANQQFINSFDRSPNKVIRDASKITSANLAPDANGVIRFNGDTQSIGAHLEGRLIDPRTLQPRVNYTGGNTVTGDKVFNDLYAVMDPQGQDALVSHVRNTVATSPASPTEIASFTERSPFFSPEERDSILRLQNARSISTAPAYAPSSTGDTTGSRWGFRFSAPLIGQNVGTTLGGMFGAPNIGGAVGTMLGSAAEGKFEGLTRGARLRNELDNLPRAPVSAPNLFAPIAAAEAVTGVTGQSPLAQRPEPQPQPQPAAAPAPVTPQAPRDPYSLPAGFEPPAQPQAKAQKPQDPYALPPGFEGKQEDPYSLPAGWDDNQGMYRGGRAAYKSGGAVGSIEPLVRNLINKAKKAKKVSDKATEPLLNAHDDAIASALEVAQKSI